MCAGRAVASQLLPTLWVVPLSRLWPWCVRLCERMLAQKCTQSATLRQPGQLLPECASTPAPHCLQAGTSHNLGDNFARAFNTRYLDEAGQLQVGA